MVLPALTIFGASIPFGIAILVLVVFLIPVFYWLLRNFAYTHNPIYPILNNVFQSFDYDKANYQAMMEGIKIQSLNFDMLRNALLRLPGDYSILSRGGKESQEKIRLFSSYNPITNR